MTEMFYTSEILGSLGWFNGCICSLILKPKILKKFKVWQEAITSQSTGCLSGEPFRNNKSVDR